MDVALHSVSHFIADAQKIVRQGKETLTSVETLAPLLERLVSRNDCLTDLGESSSPNEGFLLHADDILTIRTVVWSPNATTPIHNHNSWALIGVVEGNERNTNYRRLDDCSRPWWAQLEEVGPVDILPGHSSFILPPNDIHAVSIPAGKTVAVHVYGNNLRKQWRYQFNRETGEVKPFLGRGQ